MVTLSRADKRLRLLILGGTREARQLAEALAARTDIETTVSLAGRTRAPLALPVPMRSGGFGGAAGLTAYLKANAVDALIDATHPFAAIMSFNAAEAASAAGVPLIALTRPAWERMPGDVWREVPTLAEAVRALGTAPRRVLAALGRNEVHVLEAAPQHHYLVRSIDPVEPKLSVPSATYIEARGPFAQEAERHLLITHRIDAVLAKNSGGGETYGKIAAARELGLEVVMVARPRRPPVETVTQVSAALEWLDSLTHQRPPERRGV